MSHVIYKDTDQQAHSHTFVICCLDLQIVYSVPFGDYVGLKFGPIPSAIKAVAEQRSSPKQCIANRTKMHLKQKSEIKIAKV